MTADFANDRDVMRRACDLAAQGIGAVEPNPPVGAVVVDSERRLLGEGFHETFGGPHAEVNALRRAGGAAHGAILFVTLEPCCHTGKTPPCTRAILDAGIQKVVIAVRDPSPHAAGRGVDELIAAGLDVEVGLDAEWAARLIAPFVKRVTTSLPYVHAKWAMTLDGKIATRTGDSQWISNETSRRKVHELRGRMDGIVVGHGTAIADDPLLTARPAGQRTATRIVFDSQAALPAASKLVCTLDEAPLLVISHDSADAESVRQLVDSGVEVVRFQGADGRPDLRAVLEELGRREMTNILVEGGGTLLGDFFDRRMIDECHVFVAPAIVGGTESPGPIMGRGIAQIAGAAGLVDPQIELLDGDVYVHGPLSPAVADG